MPEIRTANVTATLSSGEGTLLYNQNQGYLQTGVPVVPPPRRLYSVVNASGGSTDREMPLEVSPKYIPYAAPKEKIIFQALKLSDAEPDKDHPDWTAFNIMVNNVSSDFVQGGVVDHKTTPYTLSLETGEVLFTTDSSKILYETKDVDIIIPALQDSIEAGSDSTTLGKDIAKMKDTGTLRRRMGIYTYTPTGAEMTKVDDKLYVFKRWTAPPITESTRLVLENFSSQVIGLSKATIVTGYGTLILSGTSFPLQTTTVDLVSWGRWRTTPRLLPFSTTSLSLKAATIYKGVIVGGRLEWQLATLAETKTTISVIVEDESGVVLSSTGGSFKYSPTNRYSLDIQVESPYPVQIRKIELKGPYLPPAPIEVPPVVPPGNGPVISIGEISKGWTMPYEFRAAVPAGTQRIMRHPTMDSGTMVVNQNGQQCTWESRLFILTPPGTTVLYWNKEGGNPNLQERAANYSLKTAVTWGQFEVKGTSKALPKDMELPLKDNFAGIPVYTPKVSIIVGGADVTKDVVSAGNMSASLFGEKNATTDGANSGISVEEGVDYLAILDGYVIEWGKVVSYRSTNVHNGTQVEIGAIDPLDYHNLDLDNVESSTIPNAYQDLAAFATSIATRAGLVLDINGADLPSNQTANVNEAYDVYGSTVTQELELVANAAACRVVSVPSNKTIKFIPLIGGGGSSGGGGSRLCPFVTSGYNLSEGYAIVEVSGVSNTIRTTIKRDIPITFLNGSNPEREISIAQDMGGMTFNRDQTRWYPEGSVNGLNYIQFETLVNGVPSVTPIPIRFNLDDPEEEIIRIIAGYRDGWYTYKTKGMPKLQSENMRLDYWIIAHINPAAAFRLPEGAIGSRHRGYFEVADIHFKVESPATIRNRLKLAPDELPDTFGPCVVGFRAYMKDMGGYGNMIEFRLGFKANGIDESKISVLPFICPPSNPPEPHKLPNKKVTVQNPFIVQERPKEGQAGAIQDYKTSQAYARGVKAAEGLTHWEALKRHQGEVKFLGGHSGSIGDTVAGMKIIDNPVVSIAPGEACWTIFKTSSYSGG